MSKTQQLITINEAAERLHLSPRKVHDLIRTRELRSMKIGRARRIPVDEIDVLTTRLLQAGEV